MKTMLILLSLLFNQSLQAGDARDIVRKSEEILRANSSFSDITMTIVKPDWQREMRMKVWALEPDYALILITEPARDKGTVTLKRRTEVWNYIPAVQRIIKIPPSMMLQSWMGSDFTNDDLVRQSSIVEDYRHSILREESYNGYSCYVIEMRPRPDAGVVWGKVLLWISTDSYLQLKAEYFDEEETPVKIMTGSDIKPLGGRTIPTYWEMTPLDKPDQKTVLKYNDLQFNIRMDAEFFSQQNMKRVR